MVHHLKRGGRSSRLQSCGSIVPSKNDIGIGTDFTVSPVCTERCSTTLSLTRRPSPSVHDWKLSINNERYVPGHQRRRLQDSPSRLHARPRTRPGTETSHTWLPDIRQRATLVFIPGPLFPLPLLPNAGGAGAASSKSSRRRTTRSMVGLHASGWRTCGRANGIVASDVNDSVAGRSLIATRSLMSCGCCYCVDDD